MDKEFTSWVPLKITVYLPGTYFERKIKGGSGCYVYRFNLRVWLLGLFRFFQGGRWNILFTETKRIKLLATWFTTNTASDPKTTGYISQVRLGLRLVNNSLISISYWWYYPTRIDIVTQEPRLLRALPAILKPHCPKHMIPKFLSTSKEKENAGESLAIKML